MIRAETLTGRVRIAQPPAPGGAGRDRTDDLKLAKLALSQLSYGPDRREQFARGMSSVPIMVGLGRLELPTSRLSGVRSNHLSYRPPLFSVRSSKSPKRHSRMLQRDRLDEKEKRRRRHPALSFW